MKSWRKFSHINAGSLDEAVSVLRHHEGKAWVTAGVTDILGMMRFDVLPDYPEVLINLKTIPGLDYIREEGGILKIGAITRLEDIARNPEVVSRYTALAEAAHRTASPHIREMGTIGGNICNGSPAADTIPPLICLGAKLEVRSTAGNRLVAVEDFFEGPQKTRLTPGEILTQIQIPIQPPRTGGIYLKLGLRKALEIAIVGVAALVTLDETKKVCVRAKLSLASVAPIPLSCRRAEAVLVGQTIDSRIIEQAAQLAQGEATPISDLRGTADYRREMVYVLTKRALKQALLRAQGLAT